MTEKLTAAQFVAKLAMTENGSLFWDSEGKSLRFAVPSVNNPVIYVAPSPHEMTEIGYTLFTDYVDTICQLLYGHGLARLLIEIHGTMKHLTVEEALVKIEKSGDHSIISDRTPQLQITVWNNGVEENYLGPDPVTTGYVNYMYFLGRMKDLGCFEDSNFINQYLKDRLRS